MPHQQREQGEVPRLVEPRGCGSFIGDPRPAAIEADVHDQPAPAAAPRGALGAGPQSVPPRV